MTTTSTTTRTTRTARPNTYAGRCSTCGSHVAAGAGLLGPKVEGRWTVEHTAGQCTAAVLVPRSARDCAWCDEPASAAVHATGECLAITRPAPMFAPRASIHAPIVLAAGAATRPARPARAQRACCDGCGENMPLSWLEETTDMSGLTGLVCRRCDDGAVSFC